MGRNGINLDQITRRLGPPSRSSDYDDVPRTHWNNDDEEEGNHLSSGFVATLAAAFLAIGSGTYFFMDGGLGAVGFGLGNSKEAFVSKADAACGGLWKDGERNDAALKCYLTTQASRFCDPQERVHLSQIISNYRKGANKLQGQLISGVYKNLAETRSSLVTMHSEVARLDKEIAKAKKAKGTIAGERVTELEIELERTLNFQGKGEFDPWNHPVIKQNTDAKAGRQAEVSHARKLQALAEAGFVSESDFGWFPDKIVKSAFAKAKLEARDPCTQATPD
jgi:hypothetical protein